MATLTKLTETTNTMVSAHRERSRLFDQLARLDLDDEKRQEMIDAYAVASDEFEKAKSKVLASATKPTK